MYSIGKYILNSNSLLNTNIFSYQAYSSDLLNYSESMQLLGCSTCVTATIKSGKLHCKITICI